MDWDGRWARNLQEAGICQMSETIVHIVIGYHLNVPSVREESEENVSRAQAFHGDQVVELRVQLAVQEVEGKEEDREGQVEVEEEKRLKEVRSWMTMEMK